MNNSIFIKINIKIFRAAKNYVNRKKLLNKNPTILSSNCNGAVIMHDLGIKFRTPTVNLYFNAKDFIKFLKNIDYYINLDLQEENDLDLEYPVGKLDDIKVYFLHYKNFDVAKEKWDTRKQRINKENIYIMMTDRDGCTYEDMLEFDKLNYKHKVIFTNKEYKNINSSYYIKGFENEKNVGILSDFQNIFGKRYLDDFDYIGFINKK